MVGELAWGHHRQREMRLHVVVDIEEFPDLFLKDWPVLLPVLVMSCALFPERPIEALDEGLLVLLVRTGIPVPFAVEEDFLVAFRLELMTAVALPDDEAPEKGSGVPEAPLPFGGREGV